MTVRWLAQQMAKTKCIAVNLKMWLISLSNAVYIIFASISILDTGVFFLSTLKFLCW